MLGIKKSQILAPQYLRILACNQKGTEILNKIRKKATIPVTPKFAQLTQIGCSQAKDESLYTDLYYLMTQNIQRGGLEYIYNPYIEF